MSETARKACLAVAKSQLASVKAHPRPMTREVIQPTLSSTGTVAREDAQLFAAMNADSNRREVIFWRSMVERYSNPEEDLKC